MKCLALDLDGTLTNSEKRITPRTLQALLLAQERGVCVILASGRPVCGQRPLAEQLQLQRFGGYILAFNGGTIVRCATGEHLVRTTLPHHLLPQIIGAATSRGFDLLSYQGDIMLSNNTANPHVQYAARINGMQLKQPADLTAALVQPVPKCIIVGEPEQLAVLEKEMQETFADMLNCVRSEPFFLEIMPCGIDKAARLQWLLQQIGARREDLVACGDGFNDISMLRFAGIGVAMGNAQPSVKEVADFVTLDNNNDGLVPVVERFFF